jgi:ABC-type sulfate transport system substrate-binding protein
LGPRTRGVEHLCLLHPHPVSAGAGSWGLVAEYSAAISRTRDPQVAREEVKAIWANVGWMAPSARAALTLFELGAGDALVTYEQDARLAAARGVPMEIVLPTRTVLAEHFVCPVSDNLKPKDRAAAEGFVDFLLGPQGQGELRRFQLRPAAAPGQGFPALIEAKSVDELGGWPQLYQELIEGLWQSEIAPDLDLAANLPVFNVED